MNSDEKTLPDLLMILEAINKLDQKIDARFDSLRQEMLHKIDAKVDELEAKVEAKFEEMRLQMMSIEARTDHLESGVHETLSVCRNARFTYFIGGNYEKQPNHTTR